MSGTEDASSNGEADLLRKAKRKELQLEVKLNISMGDGFSWTAPPYICQMKQVELAQAKVLCSQMQVMCVELEDLKRMAHLKKLFAKRECF